MKMKQREVLNHLSPDFKRDHETQKEYLLRKTEVIKKASREYLALTGKSGYLLGLSGGIDSFVAAALLADAAVRVHLLLLPYETQSDISDSIECAKALEQRFENITTEIVPVTEGANGVYKDMEASILYAPDNIYSKANVKARIRMVLQYALASDLLVVGTDHASENITGYFTKYGDGGSDFNPLESLVKQDIYEIAALYGAPECVMKKAPAAGLGISECDEQELGITYTDIGDYLTGYQIDKNKAFRLTSLYDRAEHKRHLPASPVNLWWKPQAEDITQLVLYTATVEPETEATVISKIISSVNNAPSTRVLYICDPEQKKDASSLPLPQSLYSKILKTVNTPLFRYNVFDKALKKSSLFYAENAFYGALMFNLTNTILLSGITQADCLLKTTEDLIKNGFHVSILKESIVFSSGDSSAEVFQALKTMGAVLA